MDAETFIRKQIIAILREEKGDAKKGAPAPKPAPVQSGKRMGKSAQKGKQSAILKDVSAKAVNNPGAVFGELGVDKGSIAGGTNQEKARNVILAALNNPNMSLAFEGTATVLGSDTEGWTVVAKVKVVDVEGEGKPVIPTGRAARYLGALMTAAKNLGVVNFNPDDAQSAKHDPGEQNIYINLPV